MKAAKSVKRPLIDPDQYFVSMSEEELFNLWRSYYPCGSGPLSQMRHICGLIEALATVRGIDIQTWSS